MQVLGHSLQSGFAKTQSMSEGISDPEIVKELLTQIQEALRRIELRSKVVTCPQDFLRDDDSKMRLDSIGMMLIVVGENLKRIDKKVPADFFSSYPDINWKAAKGLRDFLSHGYFQLEVEMVCPPSVAH
jgi:uncharacterized protein with HEPN domain